MLHLAEKFETNEFVFCWDSRQSYRKLFDENYKANRQDISPEKKKEIALAHKQFDELRNEILPTMGFNNIFMRTGYEADDLIAFTVSRHPENYMIVSGDNDLLQLLSNHKACPIKIYNLSKKVIITQDDFTKKYGIKPFDWIKVKAMGGCSSDGVKGIPGVGEESAIKYINGVLKEGAIKTKIETVDRNYLALCFILVSLPFPGDRPINIKEIVPDKLYSLNFMDVLRKYGCSSFTSADGFDRWKKAFKLTQGR